jgi:hypothetical protein
MDNWKVTATKELVDALGEEWNGTYEIRLLPAIEYLNIGEEIMDDLRRKGKTQIRIEDLKRSEFNYRLFLKTVLHDGKQLDAEKVPSKLFEWLMPKVVQRNTMELEAQQQLFLQPTTGNQASQREPST